MLQKELAKRLKALYDTKMDGNGWLEVSSDGIPLCRIKYNGQFLSNVVEGHCFQPRPNHPQRMGHEVRHAGRQPHRLLQGLES